MENRMLLVAIGCGRLPGILDINARQSFVVFGTMDGNAMSGFAVEGVDNRAALPVYFYETG
jgi:hypothetical protein